MFFQNKPAPSVPYLINDYRSFTTFHKCRKLVTWRQWSRKTKASLLSVSWKEELSSRDSTLEGISESGRGYALPSTGIWVGTFWKAFLSDRHKEIKYIDCLKSQGGCGRHNLLIFVAICLMELEGKVVNKS